MPAGIKNDGRLIMAFADSLFEQNWTEPLCGTLPLFPLYTEWPFEEAVSTVETVPTMDTVATTMPTNNSFSEELDIHDVLSSQRTMFFPAISKCDSSKF